MEKITDRLLAPCGLYCGVCGIYYAYKNTNEHLKEKLADAYWTKPDSIECEGCLSDKRFFFCEKCKIRNCVLEKELSGCHECPAFPCDIIENYPYKLAVKFMKLSTPIRREYNDDNKWVQWEENNWKCKKCGWVNFRGAKRCHKCGNKLEPIL